MTRSDILTPAAVLVLWSLVMLIWMGFARFSAIGAVPRDALKTLPKVGGRGDDLAAVLPMHVNWVSHNYTHLMEQPTLFYATVAILAIAGQGNGINAQLAWGYVGLRIAHSLWQAMTNTIPVRFGLFVLSTACLLAMAVNALRATL